jgi:hypothetical protein
MTADGTAFLLSSDAMVHNVTVSVRQLNPDGHELAPSELLLTPTTIAEVTPVGTPAEKCAIRESNVS